MLAFLFLGIGACVQDAPLPEPGVCAAPPEGVYEYGEIGIGTCLAGPADLAFLDNGRVLAVSNANPWGDFTGGSALFLDLDTVDLSAGRNVLAASSGGEGVAASAVGLPSFSGDMALVEPHDTLIVTNRLSDDSRTREASDAIWFLDVSDPLAPGLAEIGPDSLPTLDVGWDPVAVHYSRSTDIAWVLNRTAHSLALVDMGSDPVALVPPGGPARLDAGVYVDADATGSVAGFVSLDIVEDAELTSGSRLWNLRWSVGTVRTWLPTPDGVYRMTGNGESTWERAAALVDLDLDDADGEVLSVTAPHFFLEATSGGALARMVFSDDGVLRAAYAPSALEEWVFESDPLLEASASGWDTTLSAPAMVVDGATWLLFYGGDSGGDSAIGLAVSADGADFTRVDDAPVLAVDGASLSDPFVIYDDQIAQWRMYYTVDGDTIGEATSDDLLGWTATDSRYAPAGGASAPAVGYYGGVFHLFTIDAAGAVVESTSVDGTSWEPLGAPFVPDADTDTTGGIALQVAPEDAFTLEDQAGDTLPVTLEPGATLTSTSGWEVRVAVGQLADPTTIGMASVQLDSVVGDRAWVSWVDDAGLTAIGGAALVGDALTLDTEPQLEAGAGGDFDADGVYAPVVIERDGGYVMYYAGIGGEVTTIGRATSADGISWAAEATPMLVGESDWESVAMEPGSAQVLEDGTIRLWYSAFDGTRWRVGLAESTDGVSFVRVPGVQYDWVFDAAGPGEWFDTGVRHPYVVRDGDIDRMWFSGYSGEAWQLGYAERTGDDAEWATATDSEGSERPVLSAALGGFGVDGVIRPVVLADADGWAVWYTGLDADGAGAEQGRIGRAVGAEADRLHRDLRLPTLSDEWSFTFVPAREEQTLTLDVVADGVGLVGLGCSALAEDEDRGFLYAGCKLVPYIFVVDIRDDSTDTFDDLNYLDVEGIILVETSTGSDSGMRSLVVDRERGWLWGLADEPEGIYAIDLSAVVDDADSEILREAVVAVLPLPRSIERDEGVPTQSSVGPGQLVMHPDGRHLFASNFNNNSVSAYDLGLGPAGTLVGQVEYIGENPYALALSPDGTLLAVANYSGEVEDAHTSSTIALLDADPESPTFMQVHTWLVNK